MESKWIEFYIHNDIEFKFSVSYFDQSFIL